MGITVNKLTVTLGMLLLSSGIFAGELEESNEIFDWAEAKYPEYFSPPEAETFEFSGYLVRHYPSTENFLGTKDDMVYVYGPIFGGLVEVVSLVDALNLARSDPYYPERINIVDSWDATVSSTECPVQSQKGSISWVYRNNTYDYVVTSDNLIDPQTCQSYGQFSCDDYDFPFAGDPISEDEFTAGMNDGICTNDVYWQTTDFLSDDDIVITGIYSSATVTMKLIRMNE